MDCEPVTALSKEIERDLRKFQTIDKKQLFYERRDWNTLKDILHEEYAGRVREEVKKYNGGEYCGGLLEGQRAVFGVMKYDSGRVYVGE